jgi:murein tripeptide amidase MpaA
MQYLQRWFHTVIVIGGVVVLAVVLAYAGQPAQAEVATAPAPPMRFSPTSPLRHALIRASALYDTPLVVRVQRTSPTTADDLRHLGIDLLESHNQTGDEVVALVSAEQQRMLLAQGWQVQVDEEQTRLFDRWTLLSYLERYQTVEDIHAMLYQMEQQYPTLARVEDFGDSWERVQYGQERGYDLLALRMTSQRHTGEKPVFFLLAAIHAREMVSAEIATRFITMLLEGYGTDATITWLLDEHEVVVVPMANPDGRKVAEQGYFQRKNIDDQFGGGCAVPPSMSNQIGVDLNRNFGYQWGTVFGPDIDPCEQTFPGDEAVSEPETQAIQQFVTSLFPNHPSPGSSGQPAPDTTSGVLISLHSYAEMVLWPWGYTDSPSPNAAGLARLGRRMAAMNGYYAGQAVTLYPTSGTTDDWSYATLGIPSYTFEIGPTFGQCGGFMPPASCLDDASGGGFWQRNMPALLYAARVARAPYLLPIGPDVRELRVISDTATVTVTAMLDAGTGQVRDADLSLDMSHWYGSEPITMTVIDGAWDSPVETAQTVIPISPTRLLQTGQHMSDTLVLVRGQSESGVWGGMQPAWLQEQTPTGVLVRGITSEQDGDQVYLVVTLAGDVPIAAGEVYLGGTVWDGANRLALTPVDGAFDAREEQGEVVVPLETLRGVAGYDATNNQLVVTARGYDTVNEWGLSAGSTVVLTQPQEPDSFVVLLPIVMENSP